MNELASGERISTHRTKDEAVAVGAELAEREGIDHLVQCTDGTLAPPLPPHPLGLRRPPLRHYDRPPPDS